MDKYKVQITQEALADMEQLYNYIVVTLLAPENAMRQYNRIADAILRLDILPERFREIGSEFGRAEKLRRMVVDNYSVFYVIQEESVIVTNVLYSASDIEYRLKKYINDVDNFFDYINLIKTKRYTYNKLNRMFIHILIGLK